MTNAQTGMRWGLDRLMMVAGAISVVGFALMAVVVLTDVVTRNLGVATLPWLNEVTEYLLTIATFSGAPWLLHESGHVNVDILLRTVSADKARLLVFAAHVVGLVICAIVFCLSVSATLDSYGSGAQVFKNLIFPEWYLMLPVVWCFALCSLEFLNRLTGGDFIQ